MEIKAYFLVTNRFYGADAVRSTLGLAVENQYGYITFMNGEFPKFTDYVKENIDWIRDMEGDAFTVGAEAPEGVELNPLSIEELGERLREATHIICYGLPKQSTNETPEGCA